MKIYTLIYIKLIMKKDLLFSRLSENKERKQRKIKKKKENKEKIYICV